MALAEQLAAMSRERLQLIAEAARRLARPDAAFEVADACEALVRRRAAPSPGSSS
jgi:UDP-N-acetylglucosamine:LPS N-acetylglucosamine transferase